MRRLDFLFLFLVGLVLPLAVARFQASPGYMDAEYYFSGGREIATGQGFSEPFLWHYLDDPQGVPRPSHTYWMPMASLVATAGMAIAGTESFAASRIVFIILAGLIPVITTALAWDICNNRQLALLSGGLSLLPGFYLPYLTTTDTFTLYMLLGAAWFLLLGRIRLSWQAGSIHWAALLGLGLTAGAMHLSRADGILWLVVSCFFVAVELRNRRSIMLPALGLVMLGYAAVMAPWFLRNQAVLGTPLSPASNRVFWLTDYDDLYIYPADRLTAERWFDSGIDDLLTNRLWALGQNLQSALAVQGSIFLSPLMLLGFWQLRRDTRVRFGVLGWLLLLAVMTFLFPFAGARGGFFHSSAAFQPLLWAVAPVGLDRFLRWGGDKRGWQPGQAGRVFGAAVLLFALVFTIYISAMRIGIGRGTGKWDEGYRNYQSLEAQLTEIGALPGEIVLVNNPPGYYVAAGRMGIAIPDGGLDELLSAARRYGAAYLLLEPNHPQALGYLYKDPGDTQGMKYLGTFEDTRYFRIIP